MAFVGILQVIKGNIASADNKVLKSRLAVLELAGALDGMRILNLACQW
jgi:hypothetical protein